MATQETFTLDPHPIATKVAEFIGGIIGKSIKFFLFAVIFWGVAMWFNVVPHTTECGMCGANVYEVWSISNMDNSALVEVCSKCYDDCREDI